jgi:hypothetical protein
MSIYRNALAAFTSNASDTLAFNERKASRVDALQTLFATVSEALPHLTDAYLSGESLRSFLTIGATSSQDEEVSSGCDDLLLSIFGITVHGLKAQRVPQELKESSNSASTLWRYAVSPKDDKSPLDKALKSLESCEKSASKVCTLSELETLETFLSVFYSRVNLRIEAIREMVADTDTVEAESEVPVVS